MRDKKVIIFDFDHTLYSGNVKRKENYAYNMLCNVFKDRDDGQIKALLDKYGVSKPELTNDDVVRITLGEGRDTLSTMSPYLSEKDEEMKLQQGGSIVNPELFNLLQAMGYEIHVVSNSPEKAVRRNAGALDIHIGNNIQVHGMPYLSIFKNYKRISKIYRYREILKNSRVAPDDCIVFGNDVVADVLPAIALGMRGVVCKDSKLLTLKNIENCFNDSNVMSIGEVTTLEYQMLSHIAEHYATKYQTMGNYTNLDLTALPDVSIKENSSSNSVNVASNQTSNTTARKDAKQPLENERTNIAGSNATPVQEVMQP